MDLILITNLFWQFIPVFYIVLIIILIANQLKFKVANLGKFVAFFVVAIELIRGILFSLTTYFLWKNDAVSQFLLPPYQKINYFLSYVGYRYIIPFLTSLLVAVIIFKLIKFLNNRRGNRFFYDDEYWFVFLGILVVGHPLWVIYIFSALIIGAVVNLIRIIFAKRSGGGGGDSKKIIFSLRYIWLPLAILILILNKWLIDLPIIKDLKF